MLQRLTSVSLMMRHAQFRRHGQAVLFEALTNPQNFRSQRNGKQVAWRPVARARIAAGQFPVLPLRWKLLHSEARVITSPRIDIAAAADIPGLAALRIQQEWWER